MEELWKEILELLSTYFVPVLWYMLYIQYSHYLLQLYEVDYYLYLISEEIKTQRG